MGRRSTRRSIRRRRGTVRSPLMFERLETRSVLAADMATDPFASWNTDAGDWWDSWVADTSNGWSDSGDVGDTSWTDAWASGFGTDWWDTTVTDPVVVDPVVVDPVVVDPVVVDHRDASPPAVSSVSADADAGAVVYAAAGVMAQGSPDRQATHEPRSSAAGQTTGAETRAADRGDAVTDRPSAAGTAAASPSTRAATPAPAADAPTTAASLPSDAGLSSVADRPSTLSSGRRAG